MHRLIFMCGILSMITLAGAGGALIWFVQEQPHDAGFVRDYLLHLEAGEREQVRSFLAAAAEQGEITDAALRDYLLDDELQKRLAGLGDAGDALLAGMHHSEADIARMEQWRATLDRLAARAEGYDQMRSRADERVQEAEETLARAKAMLEEWNERMRSERLAQLVSDLDRTREPEELLPQLLFLPLSDLYFVLTNTRNGDNRAVVYAAIPEGTQRNLALLGSNPAGLVQD
jgi:hypothetical protein